MFHNPSPIQPETSWRDTLSIGDIVLFRFPVAVPDKTSARPKVRPCLVLESFRTAGQSFAVLAYGTSSRTRANRGMEIVVNQPDALLLAGLDKPTHFIGARRLSVSLDHGGFALSQSKGTPVIGRLDDELTPRMHEIRGRIHAYADIHAERRRLRREEQARWHAEGRAFMEHNRALLAARNS